MRGGGGTGEKASKGDMGGGGGLTMREERRGKFWRTCSELGLAQ